jgi:ElaB/YqjD/DUF883 family membrane-anchored ribosome-binding protein
MVAATASGDATASQESPREDSAPRTLRSDLEGLRLRAASAKSGVERLLSEAVRAQPFTATAAAAGIGFLLGGGLPRGAMVLLVGTATRIAGAWLSNEILTPKTREAPTSAEEGPR